MSKSSSLAGHQWLAGLSLRPISHGVSSLIAVASCSITSLQLSAAKAAAAASTAQAAAQRFIARSGGAQLAKLKRRFAYGGSRHAGGP